MKLFRLKHLPTGLFYTPNRQKYGSIKNNLSKKGKIYRTKYSFNQLFGGGSHKSYACLTGKEYPEKSYEYKPFIESEWQWIEYQAEIV